MPHRKPKKIRAFWAVVAVVAVVTMVFSSFVIGLSG